MKKFLALSLCILLICSMTACAEIGQQEESNEAKYKEAYDLGYEEGYKAGTETRKKEGESSTGDKRNRYAVFSGAFTATVEELIPDYCTLPGKTIAVVHFFQDKPFLLRFGEDMTGKLVEGNTYVFEFEAFEVAISDEEEPNIADYMYSIVVTDYRSAKEDETGMQSLLADVDIVTK